MSSEIEVVSAPPAPTISKISSSNATHGIQTVQNSIANGSIQEVVSVQNPNNANGSITGVATQIAGGEELPNQVPPADANPAKPSPWWLAIFKSKHKGPECSSEGSSGNQSGGNTNGDRARRFTETRALINLIEADLDSIVSAMGRIDKYKDQIASERECFNQLKNQELVGELRAQKKRVQTLKQRLTSKHKDESEDSKKKRNSQPTDSANSNRDVGVFGKVLSVDAPRNSFERSLAFKDFEALYRDLDEALKLCLLCFAVFPENAIIKKRVMIYWWIGEGFAPPILKESGGEQNTQQQNATPSGNTGQLIAGEGIVAPTRTASNRRELNTRSNSLPGTPGTNAEGNANEKTAEDYANEFFEQLIEKGFIEPVHKKHSFGVESVDSCRVNPFIRFMLIMLAKRAKFFDFDNKGNPNEDYSLSLRACLTGKELTQTQTLDKLHALFNVSEAILEFTPELFARMKNVNVLYLGRWQTSATHHIEVEDVQTLKKETINVLNGLENLNYLKFLSLQGISRITELPKSFSKLSKLTILDLRACHNLESIPEEIGSLKSLTHLDMSECYLLDQIPKGLSLLSKLQVLKGFVVAEDSEGKNSCRLNDLQNLQLRKLSIYAGLKEFPSVADLHSLHQFKVLIKLTIAWGRGSLQAKNDHTSTQERSPGNSAAAGSPDQERKQDGKKHTVAAEKATLNDKKSYSKKARTLSSSRQVVHPIAMLPPHLQKLDLKCFPGTIAPDWLKPRGLAHLKKLYIIGGKFSDLGQVQDLDETGKDKWNVEVLRLKYLTELEMDWKELLELFPSLCYLEKVKCPKLTFFPCNGNGVWVNKAKE